MMVCLSVVSPKSSTISACALLSIPCPYARAFARSSVRYIGPSVPGQRRPCEVSSTPKCHAAENPCIASWRPKVPQKHVYWRPGQVSTYPLRLGGGDFCQSDSSCKYLRKSGLNTHGTYPKYPETIPLAKQHFIKLTIRVHHAEIKCTQFDSTFKHNATENQRVSYLISEPVGLGLLIEWISGIM